MKDTELMEYLADLSKISFSPQELDLIGADMEGIIGLMDSVKEFNIDLLPQRAQGYYQQLRQDAAKDSYPLESILENAAVKKDGFFSVPKVVD